MTRDEALNSAVFGVSGVRLNDDECERVFRDLRLAGFAIVPLAPTEKMLEAARDWSTAKYGKAVGNDGATGCYCAMIAAYEKEQGDD